MTPIAISTLRSFQSVIHCAKKRTSLIAACAIFAVTVLFSSPAQALINPTLQPSNLYDRYEVVLQVSVGDVDAEKKTAELNVVRVFKGEFAPKTVTISAENEQVSQAFELFAKPGATMVAFIGQKGRKPDAMLLYPGGLGRWQVGSKDAQNPARWNWAQDINPLEDERMAGTFNGDNEQLASMMADKAAGRSYFPAVAYMQFKDDVILDTFKKPIRGVALYDIDGDGRLDVYATSDGGDRAYLQKAPMKFKDATAALGLDGLKSPSVNFADVNADGVPDVLAGAVILLGERGESGGVRFSASELLPKQAGEGLKLAAFAEIDGDGFPDVVVSTTDGGLRVYLNPGAKGGAYVDATATLGLDQEASGAGGNGYFAAGDWNGDSRTDLFYAVGKGLLLVQGEDGRFAPVPHKPEFDFRTGGKSVGDTGAGCFASLWLPGSADLVFSSENNLNWMGNIDGEGKDLIPYGNEILEGANGMLPVIAEDLNADGNVDIFAGSRLVNRNTLYLNRGYGSFMTPVAHKPDVFPGQANERGAWGAAAGDVDGDGANDLLLAGIDGSLVLIPNDSLGQRVPKEHPTPDEKLLADTHILTADVRGGTGVLGAKVTLEDGNGRILGQRVIGANIASGCRGPDTLNFAVREPGPCVLTVRFSDGFEQKWPVDLTKEKHLVIAAARKAKDSENNMETRN